MILTALSISALVVGSIALAMSCCALVAVIGIKSSTHNVQFVPIDPKDAITDPKEIEKQLNKDQREFDEDSI